MSLNERTTLAKLTLSNNHKQDKVKRNDAMRAISDNLSQLRSAMGLQRQFDQSTVKRVADLARILISSGHLSGGSIENCARFAAFLTSREMGRSVERSIYDAKEISVNFNKKGSSGKMFGAFGQTTLGNIGSLPEWSRTSVVYILERCNPRLDKLWQTSKAQSKESNYRNGYNVHTWFIIPYTRKNRGSYP